MADTNHDNASSNNRQCHQDTTKLILRFDIWKENEKLDMQQKRTPETTESKLNNEIYPKGDTALNRLERKMSWLDM
ncbi:4471_t:CDS:2 [Dentiscutata erythropus]|uniref:4471_t:CDS:1 n=1 Tax=Dentiscutata erythropus TaxID=1348616 RepID=A0A9N9EK16_9GLOM|nr:4471_t:CDS:2 [Dentiscutata erythropus]